MYVRHAAFIEGVELFAATTFGINKDGNEKTKMAVVYGGYFFRAAAQTRGIPKD